MRNFYSLKTEFTWRDVAMRVAIVVASVLVIVWFMPRTSRPSFKIELNKPWHHNDLTATFDFPVYKTDSMVRAEQMAALAEFEPYYTYDKEVGAEQVRRFMQNFAATVGNSLSGDDKRIIANRLNALYIQGIVDTDEPLGPRTPADGAQASPSSLRRVEGKAAVSIPAARVHTPREAYAEIVGSPLLKDKGTALSQLNLNDYIEPNLRYDSVRSAAARHDLIAGVPLASGVVQRGQKIIDRGTIVDEKARQVLTSYLREADRRGQAPTHLSTTTVGEMLYVLVVMLAFTVYLSIYRKEYFDNLRHTAMLYTLVVGFASVAAMMVGHNLLHVYLLPLAIVPIFIRVFMDSRTAFMAHVSLVLIIACMLTQPLEFIAVETVAGLAAIFTLRELSSRSQLFWTAAITTAAAMLTCLALHLIRRGDLTRLDTSEYTYLLVSGLVVFCAYPLLYIAEKAFGFTTDITLIELSDMNKPLLRRLSEEAPGTFNHSIQVANLAAAIARKIGANSQLVRTGALYHDIGKLSVGPIYFTENQSGGISPHEHLSCIDSAQTIIGHVTEGLRLADKNNLPQPLRDLIATHHGQGKAKYFYVKYKNDHPGEPVDDLLFTYPGPNPFTKEQATLMMADAVEAASRSLPDYTEQTIRSLVARIVDSMVDEGYFRECPITFRDIQYAKTVLIEKLKTIYHTRISYPEENKPAAT